MLPYGHKIVNKRIHLSLAAGTAALLLTAAPALAAHASPAALGKAYRRLNELCRGGSGDDPEAMKACDQRERVSARMRKLFNLCILSAKGDFEDCPRTPGPSADERSMFDVKKSQDYNGLWHLVITVHSDTATITSLTVNRGNCSVLSNTVRFPDKLRFGQALEPWVNCNPIELSIGTGFGNQVVMWDD
jgi:hypothetical protein